jgi:hypothetical protein
MHAMWCRITSEISTIRRLSTNHSRDLVVVLLWLGDVSGRVLFGMASTLRRVPTA